MTKSLQNSRMSSSIRIISAIATVLLFGRCEKVIEPGELPEQDPRIVVNAVVSTMQTPYVQISVSKSIVSGKPYKTLENAQCELYEDGEFREILRPSAGGFYVGNTVAHGKGLYELRVSAPGYTTAEASTDVPPEPVIRSLTRLDSVNFQYYNTMGGRLMLMGSIRMKLVISDDPSTRNYYAVTPILMAFDADGNPIDSVDCYMNIVANDSFDPTVETLGENTYGIDDSYVINGNELVMNLDIGASDQRPYGVPAKPVSFVTVGLTISSMSESLFRYRRTANLQAITGPNVFSEPVIVYNNVKNGLGIFGGLSAVTRAAFSGTVGTR
jgi:hypothetical protein